VPYPVSYRRDFLKVELNGALIAICMLLRARSLARLHNPPVLSDVQAHVQDPMETREQTAVVFERAMRA
jgi:hypothetical protein